MYDLKKNNFLIPIFCICMLLIFSSCLSEQSINNDARGKTDQSTMVDVHVNDDTRIAQQLSSEIKTAYCGFTNEMNYGGESRFNPSDIYVIRYEGKIGNAEIVMIGGDEIEYTSAERVLEVAGYSLVFGSGQPVYAYNNGCFYTIEDAYEKGLLSKADIYKIGTIFNPAFSSTYPSPN